MTYKKPMTFSFRVGLSASQTRKRLKGYGFGVKRVEASDRNQAIITHTATGEHRQELESLFADVILKDSLDEEDAEDEQEPEVEEIW